MQFFDTHSHYFDEKFDEDRDEIIKEIFTAGVMLAVTLGDNIENSKKAIKLAEKYDHIYSACRSTPM